MTLLTSKLLSARAASAEASEPPEALVKQVDELTQEAAALKDKLQQKETDFNGLTAETAALKDKLRQREADFGQVGAEVAEYREKLKKGQEELAEAQELIAEMEAKVVAVNQSKVGMSVELAEAIQNSERLALELGQIKAEETALKEEVAVLREKIAQTESTARDTEAAIGEMRAQAETIAQLKRLAEEKESLVGSLTEQLGSGGPLGWSARPGRSPSRFGNTRAMCPRGIWSSS